MRVSLCPAAATDNPTALSALAALVTVHRRVPLAVSASSSGFTVLPGRVLVVRIHLEVVRVRIRRGRSARGHLPKLLLLALGCVDVVPFIQLIEVLFLFQGGFLQVFNVLGIIIMPI
jgi:hypothetical protein